MTPARHTAAARRPPKVRVLAPEGTFLQTVLAMLAARADVDVDVGKPQPTPEDVTLILITGTCTPLIPAASRNADTPTLYLAQDVSAARITRLLEQGTLGVLPWPIDASTLAAWLRWAKRRGKARHSHATGTGLVLDDAAQRVHWNSRSEALPPREFDVLTHLAGYAGRTVPRRNIIDAVWQGALPTTSRALDVRISRLRHALGNLANGADVPRIETVAGIGYKLITREGS